MTSARVFAFVLVALTGFAQERAQQERARIDVQAVALDAQIDPNAGTLSATAKVTFIPQDNTSSVTFELNNALNPNARDGRRGGGRLRLPPVWRGHERASVEHAAGAAEAGNCAYYSGFLSIAGS